jgi:hypothetical protein
LSFANSFCSLVFTINPLSEVHQAKGLTEGVYQVQHDANSMTQRYDSCIDSSN